MSRESIPEADHAELAIEVREHDPDAGEGDPLAVRVIVTAADGSHPDGSGRGVYADGRFFADGRFSVRVPPGRTRIELRSGPNHVPLTIEVDAEGGKRLRIAAALARWFSPEQRGWYAGDNHVHAQHDAHAAVGTDLDYTALQARANGLSYITEAGSNVSYDRLGLLDRDDFLMRMAAELRPGAFVGHLNTPGIAQPIEYGRYLELIRRPLPAQAIMAEAHRRGGAVIHTHPLTPPYQLHWMGATELLSDAVLGRTADLLDLDSRQTELLWFAALNLGNRLGAGGSTDAALGRKRTLSPGDRRVYCRAERLDYRSITEALRRGRTFATNGGPVFAFLEIDGRGPGQTLAADESGGTAAVDIEVRSLHPLKSATLYGRGRVVKRFDVAGRAGQVRLMHRLDVPDRAGWRLLRAEDERGHWAVTSPVYIEPSRPPAQRPAGVLTLLEISNAERLSKLTRGFFAHVIVTVSPQQAIERVELLRDGQPIKTFTPDMGDRLHEERIPVTQMPGPYGPGWVWHREGGRAVHLQADWPVEQSGWYAVRLVTAAGRNARSDAARFDAGFANSHQLSVANLRGGDTELALHGYGEEMPLAEISEPFEGDHWWYPRNTYWRLRAVFGGEEQEVGSGNYNGKAALFRGWAAEGRDG